MKIKVADLPETSTSRLQSATKTPPTHTFIVNESRLSWAGVGVCLAALCMGFVWIQANAYRWQTQDRLTYGALLAGSSIFGWVSLSYLIKWFRNDFKRLVLINPLYFMRFRFDSIEAIAIASTTNWDVKHRSDRNGRYAGTEFSFTSESGRQVLKIGSLKTTNALIDALRAFPDVVSDLVQREDKSGMYSLDLLYEWRMREQQFPRPADPEAAGWRFLLQRVGPSLLAVAVAAAALILVVDPYNSYCDDQLRWSAAQSIATATAYRLYIASRPDGRHASEAHTAISNLYIRAAQDYKAAAGVATSPGVDAVINMLDFANHTGHYTVFVRFADDNEIPKDIDDRIRSMAGVQDVVSVLPSFTSAMNQARQARILERVSNSFERIIPGDILQFTVGRGTSQDIDFDVSYMVKASGEIYYPVDEERLPASRRHWYTGISFDWMFRANIPGSQGTPFGLSLISQPADLFKVAYTRTAGEDTGMTPTEVYGAMADSAFDDFGSKLLAGLAVR